MRDLIRSGMRNPVFVKIQVGDSAANKDKKSISSPKDNKRSRSSINDQGGASSAEPQDEEEDRIKRIKKRLSSSSATSDEQQTSNSDEINETLGEDKSEKSSS
eukprot:Selendium_serpulae@DN5712_c0_g2_i1.p1